jgi:transposase-like protein
MKGKAYSDEFKEQVLREVDETGNMALVADYKGQILYSKRIYQ